MLSGRQSRKGKPGPSKEKYEHLYCYQSGCSFVACVVFGGVKEANAWVEGYQPFPEGEATVVLHAVLFGVKFCEDGLRPHATNSTRVGQIAIENAALTEWNDGRVGQTLLSRTRDFSSDADR